MHYQPDCVHPILSRNEAVARSWDPNCDILVIRRGEEAGLRFHPTWLRIDTIEVKDATFYHNPLRTRAKWRRAGLSWS